MNERLLGAFGLKRKKTELNRFDQDVNVFIAVVAVVAVVVVVILLE